MSFTLRNRLSFEDLVKSLLAFAEQEHDRIRPKKCFRVPHKVYTVLSKFIDCYHVEYKLGLYCSDGWPDLEQKPDKTTEQWAKTTELITGPVESGEFDYAVMHQRGLGVSQSQQEACNLYTLAADKGFAKAQHNLGMHYSDSHPQYAQKAFEYFKLAAEQGHALSQNNLGLAYLRGNGTDKNLPLAEKYLKLAAANNSTVAAKNLAQLYRRGEYFPVDFRQALKYFKVSQHENESKIWMSILWDPIWVEAWPTISVLLRSKQSNEESTLVLGNGDIHDVLISTVVDLYFDTMPAKMEEYKQFESPIAF